MELTTQTPVAKPKRRHTATDAFRESHRASTAKACEAAKHAQRGYKRAPDEDDATYQARLDRQIKPWRANLLRAIAYKKADCSADYASNFATGHTAPDLDRSAEAAGESREELHEHIERCCEVLGGLAGCGTAVPGSRLTVDGSRTQAEVESQKSKVESQKSAVNSRQLTVESQKSNVESQESKVEGQRSKVESPATESEVRESKFETGNAQVEIRSSTIATDNRKPTTVSHKPATDNRKRRTANRQPSDRQPVTGKLVLALAYVLWRVLRVVRTQVRWERLALAYRLRELACWRQRHPALTAERLNRLRSDLYLTLSDVLAQSTRLQTLQKRFESLWTALFDPVRWAEVVAHILAPARRSGERDHPNGSGGGLKDPFGRRSRLSSLLELICRTRSKGELDWRVRLDGLAAQTLGLPFLSPSSTERKLARHDAPVSLAASDPQITQMKQQSKSARRDHGVSARGHKQAAGRGEASTLGGAGKGNGLGGPNKGIGLGGPKKAMEPGGRDEATESGDEWFAGGIWEGDLVTMTSRHPTERALRKMVKDGSLKDIASLEELRALLKQGLGCGEPGAGNRDFKVRVSGPEKEVAALAEALWTRMAGFGEMVDTLEHLLKATLEYHSAGSGAGIADCRLPIDEGEGVRFQRSTGNHDTRSKIQDSKREVGNSKREVGNSKREVGNSKGEPRNSQVETRNSGAVNRQSCEPATENREPAPVNRQSSIDNRQSAEPATGDREPATVDRQGRPTFAAMLQSRLRATGSRRMMEDVWVPTRLDSPGASPLDGIREWFEATDDVLVAGARLSQKIDVALYEIAVGQFGIRREFVEWRPELSLNQWTERRGRPEWDPRVVTVDGKVLLKVRGEEVRELDH